MRVTSDHWWLLFASDAPILSLEINYIDGAGSKINRIPRNWAISWLSDNKNLPHRTPCTMNSHSSVLAIVPFHKKVRNIWTRKLRIWLRLTIKHKIEASHSQHATWLPSDAWCSAVCSHFLPASVIAVPLSPLFLNTCELSSFPLILVFFLSGSCLIHETHIIQSGWGRLGDLTCTRGWVITPLVSFPLGYVKETFDSTATTERNCISSCAFFSSSSILLPCQGD
jgi:hypothetical protein